MSRSFLAAAALLAWTVALADDKPPPRVEPSLAAPLGEVLEWTSAEGKPYGYRLPRRIDPQKPPNLLFMLHGTGLKWGWAFWNYPIAGGRFRGNDIVIAPEGMTPGQGDTFNFIQGKADGQQIAGLIGALKKAFPIAKVYVYGHSQGAFFAYWFAGEHPELVDGIVAHAGNVLDVKHPPLAKDKVAIGILHGKADAVVPVECAYRTEKLYREKGYKKLKLMIVEGLTEQSGHWPLPRQAGEMLDWLDSVSQDTPRGAAGTALSELAKEEPDLGVVVEAVSRGNALLKAYKAPDKAALAEQLKALAAFIDEVQAAHAEAVKATAGTTRKEKDYGPWAAHFRAAEAALGRLESWQSSAKQLRARSQAHDRTIAGLLPLLERPGAKEIAAGLKAAEQAFLGSRYVQLVTALERVMVGKSKAIKSADADKLRALLDARRAADEEGGKAAAAKTRELAAKLRGAHRAWFESRPGE